MGYLGDESCRQMAAEIAEQFEANGGEDSSTAVKAEFARLARITQELESQLREHPDLVAFAKRVGRLLRSPETLTSEERQETFVVGNRMLRLPELQTFEFGAAEFVETVEGKRARSLQQIPHEFEIVMIEVRERKFLKGHPVDRDTFTELHDQLALDVKNVVILELNREIVIQREVKQDWQYVEHLAEGLTLELVKIPAGSFSMGAAEDELESYRDEYPHHEVTLSEFYVGKYSVTQAQWQFVASLPEVERSLESNPSFFKGNDRPVEQVSWLDVVEFCARLSQYTGREYRLPTEAEWEYACRAGTTTPFHFGETIDAEIANYCAQDEEINEKLYPGRYGRGRFGKYRKQTTPVGSFQVANAFGLFDMHGNVWEWCLDNWHDNYEDAPTDGSVWLNNNEATDGSLITDETINRDLTNDEDALDSARRLLRGGSWGNNPRYCRSAFRIRDDIDHRTYGVGFRVVSPARILP